MLSKPPGARYADADALLDAILELLRGAQTSAPVHPVRPVIAPERVTTIEFEWSLQSPPDALWPYVSNTDRLNRAVGLPPAVFQRTVTGMQVETRARNRVAGVDLRWREHPFEWIEGRRWGVLRVFDKGVMHWFTIELDLTPKPEGGTRLRYKMTFEPRNAFGRWIVQLEMRAKQKAALGRAFERIDAVASKRGGRSHRAWTLRPGDRRARRARYAA